MRVLGTTILTWVLAAGTLPAAAQQAALFDELAEVYPDTDPGQGVERFTCDTPRGVPAGVHALIRGLDSGVDVRWRLTEEGRPVESGRAFQLHAVPVEQNTGLTSRTEVWDGEANPHVIRRAPFHVFEVLSPIGATAQTDAQGVLALRIEVPIAARDPAANRLFDLNLIAGDWQKTLTWELRVHAVTVPPGGPQSPGYTNWFSTANIANRHDLKIWSEPFWAMLGRYADLMARGRQNTFLVHWRGFLDASNDGELRLDRRRLRRYLDVFLDRGFTRVEGGHLAHRHQGDWGSARLDVGHTGSDVTSVEGQAELALLLKDIHAALHELELPEEVTYLQHLSDEPTNTNAESYRELAATVRHHLPGVRIFEATMSEALEGAVDHWCPQVQEYQKHRDFFEARREAGERIWVYTCLIPGGPWLNRLLDQERLRQVYLGWALVRYDLEGFLHWGLNHYRRGVDPHHQSVVPHGKGPPNFLPAGDSHVVYPGPEGPLSGQRFEAHRIGMEDAELLRMLKARDPARAQGLIQKLLRGYDDYATDLVEYRAVRRELLEALQGQPPR